MTPTMISLIIAALTYLLASSNGASSKTALATAALAGVGTYAVANETEWGQKTFPAAAEGTVVKSTDGTDATYPSGAPVKAQGSLSSWLSSNATPLAIGAAAGVAGSSGSSSGLWLLGGAALLFFALR